MKSKKLLVFDMDGTIADLYGQKTWLEDVRAEKVEPYINAKPLLDMNKLVSLLNKLKDRVEIAVVTWGSKIPNREYLRATARAKRQWLDKYNFPYDRFHCTSYGYSKRYPVSPNKKRNDGIPYEQVLFDDNPDVRKDWEKWENHKAYSQDDILDYLSELVKEVENGNEIDFHIPETVKEPEDLYMVLDCETATLPFIKEWDLTPKDKQKLSIAKPIIYDIGWRVIDKHKRVYSQHSFLVQETFFVPNIFNTAYYSWKRPLYMDRYKKGEIKCALWEQISMLLMQDLKKVKYATAYNAMFDFKKAIPFTENYMSHLYESTYQHWEDMQKKSCKSILMGVEKEDDHMFDKYNFEFRGKNYPIADIWGIACERLINKDDYRLMCLDEGMISASGLYFKTSAESSFRYLMKDTGFEEEHTALSDVVIETDILYKALEMGDIEQGIIYFPFKNLGETVKFCCANKEKISRKMFGNLYRTIIAKLNEYEENAFDEWGDEKKNPFKHKLINALDILSVNFKTYAMSAI